MVLSVSSVFLLVGAGSRSLKQIESTDNKPEADGDTFCFRIHCKGEYIVVITDRTKIGRIGEDDIFKVKDYKVLPLSRNNLALTETQV